MVRSVIIRYHLQGVKMLFHHTHQVVGVCGNAHWLVEAFQRPFHFLAVRLLANQYTNRGVVFRSLDQFVHSCDIETQLPHPLRLERLYLQLNGIVAHQLQVIEQQIYLPTFTPNSKFNLLTLQQEVRPHFQQESAKVVDKGVL